jgi:hypothetical protein
MIHLDAHADLRDSYQDEKLSHATVMRRCWNFWRRPHHQFASVPRTRGDRLGRSMSGRASSTWTALTERSAGWPACRST